MISIEKNIPMPKRNTRSGNKYPFADMAVGDSFAADVKPASLGQAARTWAKADDNGKKFVVRPEGEGVSRVWRAK